ncbi:hypothetical protein [Mesomycoplasma neurolyticum]|uniref:hypothetical protein n=1 Tax=Mesomycoplasma neurolyticum TaxID=2120 RepID=UPI00101DF367|nr:hypothetical protein [Mesomycoplasma neurolyticum]
MTKKYKNNTNNNMHSNIEKELQKFEERFNNKKRIYFSISGILIPISISVISLIQLNRDSNNSYSPWAIAGASILIIVPVIIIFAIAWWLISISKKRKK